MRWRKPKARPPTRSMGCGSKKPSGRSVKVAASSRKSPGAGARSAPTAGSATSSIRKSPPSMRHAPSLPRRTRASLCVPPSSSSEPRSRRSGTAAKPRRFPWKLQHQCWPQQRCKPPAPVARTRGPVALEAAKADEEVAPREVETAFNEPELPVETAAAEVEPPELSQEEADAQDEAVLEMVAAEMAAPDPDEADDFPDVADSEPVHVTTPPIVQPLASFVREVEEVPPAAAQAPPSQDVLPVATRVPSLQPVLSATPPGVPELEAAPSLGSTLLASGILRKPNSPSQDPLAPIRRMSQAEKIAFFS